MAAPRTSPRLRCGLLRARRRAASTRALSGGLAACLVLGASACAEIPKQRYGIEELTVKGAEELDEQALKACLATRERDSFAVNLGASAEPECGVPPFDAGRLRLEMWTWGWTDWPLYDQALWSRDIERIERWYRARGYYDARVVSSKVEPPSAASSDRLVVEEGDEAPCERNGEEQGCTVRLSVEIEEGEPVRVQTVTIEGDEHLPPSIRESLREGLRLQGGDRWDEARYDRSKNALSSRLAEASYACARVRGEARINPETKKADVTFTVDPGRPAVFGEIEVKGNEDLPARAIRGAAFLEEGDRYSESAMQDAQRAIYALGALSSVQLRPKLPREGCPPPREDGRVEIPITIEVSPAKRVRFGLGGGVQSGTLEQGGEVSDVRQWDVHLLGIFEHRNLFGGMRRLRIEERPRLIFNDVFPQVNGFDFDNIPDGEDGDPALGNTTSLEFRQPAFLEPRTTLVYTARWDLGPEPFGNRFFRHVLDTALGLERNFLDGHVFLSGGIHFNLLRVVSWNEQEPEDGTIDYELTFWEQYVQLDLRDDPRRPRRGAFFALGLHEAGFGLPSSWDYVRTTPEARGYIPLPLGMVLAFRFGIGAIFVVNSANELEPVSAALGPEVYRLRGGGASSNRGFIPGDLGVGIDGGRRRWESSLELRVPLTQDFGLVLFGDAGDVSQGSTFRFDHPQPSVGGGLRYQTVVGPLRLDVGYRIPKIQVVGGPDPSPRYLVNLGFTKFAGAVHLTIGESF